MASDVVTIDKITSYTLGYDEFPIITDTGIIRNNPTTITVTGTLVDITNDGLIFSADSVGINVQAGGAWIDNGGRITGFYGILPGLRQRRRQLRGARIFNHGTISGSSFGVDARGIRHDRQ